MFQRKMSNLASISVALALVLFLGSACGKVKVDKEVMEALKAIPANCKVEVRYGSVKDCKNGEKKKFEELIKAKGRAVTLGTVSVALHDKDVKLQATAAGMLYTQYKDYFTDIAKNPQVLEGAVVDSLIGGVKNITGYVSMYAARTAVHAAMIKGKEGDLYKVLSAHPQEVVRTEAYANLMTFGRLKAFPVVKKNSESSDMKIKRTALWAADRMYKYTDKEVAEICPWAEKFIGDSDYSISSSASRIMGIHCGGKYRDKVLDLAEKAEDIKALKQISSGIYFSCGKFFTGTKKATEEQCKRSEPLKAKIKASYAKK